LVDSPDWYAGESGSPKVEVHLPLSTYNFFQAGSSSGWSWFTIRPIHDVHSCEISWLDPEPNSDSSDYEACVEELQRIERSQTFTEVTTSHPLNMSIIVFLRVCGGGRRLCNTPHSKKNVAGPSAYNDEVKILSS
jgi:MoaA/NifB/PqqE/SkfB family radical SAM enzyme